MSGDQAQYNQAFYNSNQSSPYLKNRGLTIIEQMNIPMTTGGSSNVHDNYAAYRINTNMGVSSGSNIPNKARKELDEVSPRSRVDNYDPIRPHNSQSPVKTTFLKNGTTIINSPGYSNRFSPPSDYYMFNQPYTDPKPTHQSNKSFGSHPPFALNSFANLPLKTLLPPIYSNPELLANLSEQNLRVKRKERKESYTEFAKLVSRQTKNLEKILKRFGGDYADEVPHSSHDPKNKEPKKTETNRIKPNTKHNKLLQSERVGEKKAHENAPSNSALPELVRNPHKKSSIKLLSPLQVKQDFPQKRNDTNDDDQSPLQEKEPPLSPLLTEPKTLEKNSKKPLLSKKIPKKKKKCEIDIKIIMWTIAYPLLFKADIEKKIENRRKKADKVKLKKVPELTIFVIDHIKKHCMQSLKSFYKDVKSYVIVNEENEPKKKIPEKTLKKTFTLIIAKLITVLDNLNKSFSEIELGYLFLGFFSSISQNNSFIPKGFLTEFEASCLEFTSYGALKGMTPMKSKMLMGMFVLVKGLLFAFFTQPWTVLPTVKRTPALIKGLKNSSSIFYHAIMEIFKDNLTSSENAQENVAPEKKLKTTKTPLIVFHDEEQFTPSEDEKKSEVIIGLYNKSSLEPCWVLGKELVDELKNSIEQCLEKLYFILETSEKVKEEQK